MKDRATLKREMDDALKVSDQASKALGMLVEEAKAASHLDDELFAKILAADLECDKKMHMYLDAYRAYHSRAVE